MDMADIYRTTGHRNNIVFHSSAKEMTHILVRSSIHYPNGFKMCGNGEGKKPIEPLSATS